MSFLRSNPISCTSNCLSARKSSVDNGQGLSSWNDGSEETL
jgi:hypothetical protein